MAAAESNEPTILDYLNEDCWRAVLDLLSVKDVLRTEPVSQRWQGVVLTYLRGFRLSIQHPAYRNAEAHHVRILTLKKPSSFESCTIKLGSSVVHTFCNSNRFYEIITENCPNVEAITFVSLQECINQNGRFKYLRRICFNGCYSISVDYCISQITCNNALEELEINSSNRATGYCLTSKKSANLKSLILKHCENIQIRFLPNLCQLTKLVWVGLSKYNDIHLLLDKMQRLEFLQFEIQNVEAKTEWIRIIQRLFEPDNVIKTKSFFESVCRLGRLKHLTTNVDATDDDLDAVTRCCKQLRVLMLGSCKDVTRRGLEMVCRNAGLELTALGIQCSKHLTNNDVMVAISSCPNLEVAGRTYGPLIFLRREDY